MSSIRSSTSYSRHGMFARSNHVTRRSRQEAQTARHARPNDRLKVTRRTVSSLLPGPMRLSSELKVFFSCRGTSPGKVKGGVHISTLLGSWLGMEGARQDTAQH